MLPRHEPPFLTQRRGARQPHRSAGGFLQRFDAEPPVGQPKTAASPSDPFGTDAITAEVDDDVASLLELKPYTVKEYARRGILPGRKLGRTWRFLRPELEDAIRRLPKPDR